MNSVDKQYHNLLKDILENGSTVGDERTGVGTKAVFGRQLRFNMQEGLPVITTKKMYFKGIIGELLWFLGNHTKLEAYKNLPLDNIKYLIDNKINIWVGDMYKAYVKWIENYTVKSEGEPPFDYLVEDVKENRLRLLTEQEFIESLRMDSNNKFNRDFIMRFGCLGKGYGWQWRHFGGDYNSYIQTFNKSNNNGFTLGYKNGVDQIQQIIDKLKTNPSDRRLIVTAWNPEDLDKTTLPPCHYGFSLYARKLSFEERLQWVMKNTDVEMENLAITGAVYDKKYNVPEYALSLMERQRSVDSLLGLPFNITSYGILLELIARETNMVPDELIMSLENTHVYLNHIDAVKEQLSRTKSYPLPKFKVNSKKSIFDLQLEDFEIIGYQSEDKIKAKLNN